MKFFTAGAAVRLLGKQGKEVALWENEGPLERAHSYSQSGGRVQPQSSDVVSSSGGKLDVKLAEIQGIERATGGPLRTTFGLGGSDEELYLVVQLGSQVQETGDAAYLPWRKSCLHPSANKAFRFMLEDGEQQKMVVIKVYKKTKTGEKGQLLAKAHVLLAEAFRIGFHNVRLTLVNGNGLPSIHLRVAIVHYKPKALQAADELAEEDERTAALRKSRRIGSRHVLLAGDAEEGVAVPDQY